MGRILFPSSIRRQKTKPCELATFVAATTQQDFGHLADIGAGALTAGGQLNGLQACDGAAIDA